MTFLERAGLAHLAAHATTDPDPTADTFDLVRFRREQAHRYLAGHRCHRRFGDATLTDPKATAWVARILANDPRVAPTLLVTGPTGTGKSRLAWAALTTVKLGRAEQGRGCPAWMVGHADLNVEMRAGPDRDPTGTFTRYATADLLVLDDLAATRATDNSEEALYRLLETRWLTHSPTIVVTNLTIARPPAAPGEPPALSPLERAVGSRVASRILDATVVVLAATDHRLADARARARTESGAA